MNSRATHRDKAVVSHSPGVFSVPRFMMLLLPLCVLVLTSASVLAQDPPRGKEAVVAPAGEGPRERLLAIVPESPLAVLLESAAWRDSLADRVLADAVPPLASQSVEAFALALVAIGHGEALFGIDPVEEELHLAVIVADPELAVAQIAEALGFTHESVEIAAEGNVVLHDVRPGRPEWIIRRNRPEFYVVTAPQQELLFATNQRGLALQAAARISDKPVLELSGDYDTLDRQGTEWLETSAPPDAIGRFVLTGGSAMLFARMGMMVETLLLPWDEEPHLRGFLFGGPERIEVEGEWLRGVPPALDRLTPAPDTRIPLVGSLPPNVLRWTAIRGESTDQVLEYWLTILGIATATEDPNHMYHARRRFEEWTGRSLIYHLNRHLGEELVLVEVPGTIEEGGTELAALMHTRDEVELMVELRRMLRDDALDLRQARFDDYTLQRFVVPGARQTVYFGTRHGAFAMAGSERAVRILLNAMTEIPLPSERTKDAGFVHRIPHATLASTPQWMEAFVEEGRFEHEELREIAVMVHLEVSTSGERPTFHLQVTPGTESLLDFYFGAKPAPAMVDQGFPESVP